MGLPPAKRGAGALVRPDRLAHLRDLLRNWLAAKKEETQRTYRSDLEDFTRFWGRWQYDGAPSPDVDAVLLELFTLAPPAANAAVLQYRQDLLERPAWSSRKRKLAGESPDQVGLAPATVNRRLSALRSIAKIARIAGAFKGKIEIEGVPARKYRDTKGVGAEGYHRLLEYLDAEIATMRHDRPAGYRWAQWPRALRDRAILRLLHDAALRRAEVVRLRRCDVFPDDRSVLLHPKGPRGATLPWGLGAEVWDALVAWLQWRGEEEGALFHRISSPDRAPFNLSSVNKIIRGRGDEVGVFVRPHDLRHTGITTALDRTNGNVRLVSKFSRHKDLKTVMVYDDQRQEVARNIQDMIATPEDDDDDGPCED